MSAGVVEDMVVDLALEVDSAEEADALAGALVLPGVEILRASSASTVWVTVLVAAESRDRATEAVRAAVLPQVAPAEGRIRTVVVTSAPLGELHARLDLADDEARAELGLRDLVETLLWERSGVGSPSARRAPAHRRAV